MEISAIVIARSGSVRVKDKSLLPFGEKGDTLITHKIKQLKACNLIDRVIFGSDSTTMLEQAKSVGAEVFKREDYFCDESKCSINEAIQDMCKKISTDIVLWAHCTNPLVSAETYKKAINQYLENSRVYDSLLSVFEIREHLWGVDKTPFNYNPYQEKHPLAKSLSPFYAQDGAIFIQPHLQMLSNKYFFGNKPMLFITPENELADINNEKDYAVAKFLYEREKKNV